jgi:rhomboid family GlyGly-CTERM serine protease
MRSAATRGSAAQQDDEQQAGRRAWLAAGGLMALGAVVGWWLPHPPLEWRPDRAWFDPWRWWTPAFLHLSLLHLAANLSGVAAVLAVGWTAEPPRRLALAWLIAWPLTHGLLLVQPALTAYAGLSGVLHAGVACLGWQLVWRPQATGLSEPAVRRRRWIGIAILAVLIGKVLSETPWGPAARAVEGWDIAVAPIAHATGVAAGLLSAWLVDRWSGRGPAR